LHFVRGVWYNESMKNEMTLDELVQLIELHAKEAQGYSKKYVKEGNKTEAEAWLLGADLLNHLLDRAVGVNRGN